VSISVITMEGEDCKLDDLGTVADITSGQVEIVDPAQIGLKVVSMLNKEVLAINVKATLLLGQSLQFRFEEKIISNKNVRELGLVTKESDLTFSYEVDDISLRLLQDYKKRVHENETDQQIPLPGFLAPRKSDSSPLGSIPIQLQVEFTRSGTKEKILKVVTFLKPITFNRLESEEKINSTAVALTAIQTAAAMAQKGEYNAARIELVSVVRLLQRSMTTIQHQNDYMNYIVQAEKLDQFMRETQQQKLVMGSRAVNAQRDDAASQAMYKMKTVPVKAFADRK